HRGARDPADPGPGEPHYRAADRPAARAHRGGHAAQLLAGRGRRRRVRARRPDHRDRGRAELNERVQRPSRRPDAQSRPYTTGGTMRGAMTLAAVAGGLALGLVAAAAPAAAQQKAGETPPNTLTAEEEAAGWRLLFDGKTTAGWRGYRKQGMPEGWQVVDGALARVGPGGDIITVDQFQDFELTLEWMVAPGGNSGIFFRASEDTEWIYQNAPEMQVLDDAAHQDGLQRETAAGSNYGLHPAPEGVVKPA